MIYLEQFRFPTAKQEDECITAMCKSLSSYCDDAYPFKITTGIDLYSLDFEPITLLCGGNGCGKSTILNIIGRKLCADRHSLYNSTVYMDTFVSLCKYTEASVLAGDELFDDDRRIRSYKYDIKKYCHVITSDDIFQSMLDLRLANEQKLHKSFFIKQDQRLARCNNELDRVVPSRSIDLDTGNGVKEFNALVEMRKLSFKKYMEKTVGKMERGFSNGETALMKLSEKLETPGLYILDEPENSMSCEFQMRLANLIEFFAYRGKCQFIIATHSPFLMAMQNAKIYNLDHTPVDICNWWELENIKPYFELFEKARDNFIKGN